MSGLTKRLSVAVVALLASAAFGAGADLRTSASRPNVVEVGPARALTRLQLEREMYRNSDLRSWVLYYGYPDRAEYQAVVPQFGWADYEIHTYYPQRNQKIVFSRVAAFPYDGLVGYPSYPGYPGMLWDYGLIKYQGPIPQDPVQPPPSERRGG